MRKQRASHICESRLQAHRLALALDFLIRASDIPLYMPEYLAVVMISFTDWLFYLFIFKNLFLYLKELQKKKKRGGET